jgi:hypothetical protein
MTLVQIPSEASRRGEVRYCIHKLRQLRKAGDSLGNRVSLGLKVFRLRRTFPVERLIAFNARLSERCIVLGVF